MHLLAYLFLAVALLCALAFAGAAAFQLWKGRTTVLPWVEKSHIVLTTLMTLSSLILLMALARYDFSNEYIASYTSLDLPVFYRLTAFWAGQAGSLLFWGWSVAIFGVFFLPTRSYQALSAGTKLWFWLFFLVIMAFFLLLLTTWSNPFILISPPPADGNGLNPLLQNPGMIFHPPLLFLGYGGFVIPGCLALAQALNNSMTKEMPWAEASRNFTLIAWLFLTAGIILGAWWAYMELGWGGYWAWDPVENASLIPWLVSSAFLHTSVIEARRNKLHRTNIFLMALTTISAFFATYLVRSGVVDSLHAFGDGGVGTPLLIFIIASTAVSLAVALLYRHPESRELSDLFSREGFLVLAAWALLALGIIILVATMWPVFSKFWSENPVGLEPAFYNRVCLPLFVLLSVLLMVCPWLSWKQGFRDSKKALIVGGIFLAVAAGIYAIGFTVPMALVGSASAVAAMAGFALKFATEPGLRKNLRSVAAYGVHVGLALCVIGVAFSGPYKEEKEANLKHGESVTVGDYTITYEKLYEGNAQGYIFIEAELAVKNDGKDLGTVNPQRRLYNKFKKQSFAEVRTIPTLGDELYTTLLGAEQDGSVVVKISVNPLINWIWIGGTLMCLFPFLGLRFKEESDPLEPNGTEA